MKPLVLFFVPPVIRKVQKVKSINIQTDCETMRYKTMWTHLHIYMQWKSTKRWSTLIHKMILKQQVKNEQVKRKQTCSVCFVKVFKFLQNKFKVIQKNF